MSCLGFRHSEDSPARFGWLVPMVLLVYLAAAPAAARTEAQEEFVLEMPLIGERKGALFRERTVEVPGWPGSSSEGSRSPLSVEVRFWDRPPHGRVGEEDTIELMAFRSPLSPENVLLFYTDEGWNGLDRGLDQVRSSRFEGPDAETVTINAGDPRDLRRRALGLVDMLFRAAILEFRGSSEAPPEE